MIKRDNSGFLFKLETKEKLSLTTTFKTNLIKCIDINALYTKTVDAGDDVDESAIECVGRDLDLGLSEIIIEISTQKSSSHMEIWFKMVPDHTMENIDAAISFFKSVIRNSFDTDELQTSVLLKNEKETIKMEKVATSSTLIVLPAMKSSFEYIFTNLKYENHRFVEKLNDAGVDWLDFVFNRIDVDRQTLLFGKEARKNEGSPPFFDLIQYIEKGGETMVRQREDLINMLIRVDENENKGKKKGPERIMRTLKKNLDSSRQGSLQ